MSKTALYDQHIACGGKMVDFAAWQMPIHYGSQIAEHHAVRKALGMFDVSHMGIVDITGAGASHFLARLVANDVTKLSIGRALYSCMLNDDGGVMDDLIVYHCAHQHYRLVINAATAAKDWAWLNQQSVNFDVTLIKKSDAAIVAVQGPQALDAMVKLYPIHQDLLEKMRPFDVAFFDDCCMAATGYTGERGFELMLSNNEVANVWQTLMKLGAKPCGLAARDTLRLEAGMYLYGHDMTEETSPFDVSLNWTVDLKNNARDFIGKSALQKRVVTTKMVGLMLKQRGVLREGQKVVGKQGEGVVTSGTFSPTLKQSIALAKVAIEEVDEVQVDIRGQLLPAKIVPLPFVRGGKILVS